MIRIEYGNLYACAMKPGYPRLIFPKSLKISWQFFEY